MCRGRCDFEVLLDLRHRAFETLTCVIGGVENITANGAGFWPRGDSAAFGCSTIRCGGDPCVGSPLCLGDDVAGAATGTKFFLKRLYL